MNRAEILQRLQDETVTWDVLVIGGGASGLATAVEAAARGYRTALVEQGDFAQATSSRSTKLIHGGIRYLKQGQLALVRESLRERGHLLRNAPHLVHRLPFILPLYTWWERPFYGAGLKLYDHLAGNLAIGCSKHLSRQETIARMPGLARNGLRGGILYHDGQFDDARLAITLAQTAADLGGAIANYVKVVSLLKPDGRVCGAAVRELESGKEFEIRARAVVNATGVFSDGIRRLDDAAAPELLALSRGAHIVLDKSFWPGGSALIIPRTSDGRVFFAIPWHGRVLLGTTDMVVTEAVLEPRPLRLEIEFLLVHAARYLAEAPKARDILSAFAGLRPLVKSGTGKTSKMSRSHEVVVAPSGLVSLIGGKWTTSRFMAEDTVNQAAAVGGLEARISPTKDLRLHGWREAGDGNPELAEYGLEAEEVVALGENVGDDLLHPRLPYRVNQVHWAAQQEMARTVEDVLSRRLRALVLDAQAAMEMAPHVARILAVELGRDEAWEDRQVSDFRKLALHYLVK
ncbi:MAG TPA: glycerol-3-phosphate dehydrogenase/oxidase [Candidatus Acidoferrales bacterium]|jgi:glycerol-3-phosphate dehydrogenase|nr:glycerol-3-phosphate dehydrogenase/oxidase [Candidatus Acidoferrales bacterium]